MNAGLLAERQDVAASEAGSLAGRRLVVDIRGRQLAVLFSTTSQGVICLLEI
jgi:hypothetical protein